MVGIVTAMIIAIIIYVRYGFKKGMLAIKNPANTKLVTHKAEPMKVYKINFLKLIFIMPATMGAKVRIMGKKSPATNATPPYFV